MKFAEKCKKGISKIGAACAAGMAALSTSIVALAAEPGASGTLTDDVMQSVSSGMTEATSGVGGVLKIAVPVIIGVVVAIIVAKAGIAWLKGIGSKAK